MCRGSEDEGSMRVAREILGAAVSLVWRNETVLLRSRRAAMMAMVYDNAMLMSMAMVFVKRSGMWNGTRGNLSVEVLCVGWTAERQYTDWGWQSQRWVAMFVVYLLADFAMAWP